MSQWDGFQISPWLHTRTRARFLLTDFEQRQGREATIDVRIFAGDGASSNEKFVHNYCANYLPKDAHVILKECSNHNEALIDNAFTDTFSPTLGSDIYCMCAFANMGQHWQRVGVAIDGLVSARMVPKGTVMPADTHFIDLEELSSYAVDNHGIFENVADSSVRFKNHNVPGPNSKDDVREKWNYLRRTLQVAVCEDGCKYVPVTGPTSAHRSVEHETTARLKVSMALQSAGASRKPRPPARNKWTQLGPALDVFVVLWLLGVAVPVMGPGPRSAWRAFTSSDNAWHAVAGVYLKRFHKNMHDEFMLLLLSLTIVLEPSKYLTTFFMEHNRRHQGVGYPGLLNLVTAATSPLTSARQYLSGLLRGESSRFKLILSKCKCATLGEWASAFPAVARQLRRAIRIASANIWWRHCREYLCDKAHLHLLGLCDLRIPFDIRLHRFNRFLEIEPCCIRFGFARILRRLKCDLLGPTWQRVLWRISIICKLSICDIECRHARCKRSLGHGMAWAHFAATYVIDKMKRSSQNH